MHIHHISEPEQEFQQLNNEFETARREGDINTQRKLRGRINTTYERRQSYGDQLMQVRQYLSITSYTLFKSGNEEGANEIINLVNLSFEGTPFLLCQQPLKKVNLKCVDTV